MNNIRTAGARALSESPLLAGLTRLELGSCHISVHGAEALASSPYLTRLADLDLHSSAVGNAGLTALAQSTSLASLTVLDLSWSGNAIGLDGVRALTSSPHWTGAVQLDLRRNQLSPKVEKSLQAEYGNRFGNFHRPFAYG